MIWWYTKYVSMFDLVPWQLFRLMGIKEKMHVVRPNIDKREAILERISDMLDRKMKAVFDITAQMKPRLDILSSTIRNF